MSITAFSFRNYRFVIVVTTAALALGVLGFLRMPRQEDPTLSAFSGVITVVYPGASVDEIEEEIIEPLERAIHGLEEVDLVESTARPGFATVNAEFREDSDKDRAFDLLLQELSAVEPNFPDGVVDVRSFAGKPSNVAVMQIVVHSAGGDRAQLLDWAEELEARLRSLPDVKEAVLRGELEREVHVMVDPDRLAESGLTLGNVQDALSAGEARIPGGAVSAGTRRLSVRSAPRYESPESIGAAVLRTVDGRPVRVQDVARVALGTADPNYLVRHGGEPGVSVVLTMKEGHNVFDLSKDVGEVLTEFRADLPAGFGATIVADQSKDVSERLHEFGGNLLQGGIIIALFVAVLAGWRPALAVVAALLLSVGVSFWLLSTFGLALQQMSIAGLVVVLGLLVDNAIVVVESILQRRREGASIRDAAIGGSDLVASAVASSTATTVAAFVPMMLMAGSVGEFTRDIPIVVSVVLIVSLVVALCLTPLLASLTMGDGREGRSLSPWFRKHIVDGFYRRSMERALGAPYRALGIAFAIGLVPFALAPFLGMNFFPRAEKDIFLVRVHAPEGTSVVETSRRTEAVEAWLEEQPEVVGVTTNLGEGNPMVYYNQLRAPAATHFAELLVEVSGTSSEELPELARRTREAFQDSPDFVLETKTFTQGPPIGLPVSLRLYGDDLERLSLHADQIAAELRRIPGAINVHNGLRPGAPRLDLEVDPVKTRHLGLNGLAVAREVRLALAGARAAEMRRDEDGIDVVVRVAESGNERIDDLERIRFPLPGGGSVPLAQLTRPTLAPTFAEISHTNLERSVIVGADVDGRLATEVMADLLPFAESLDLRADESFEVIGEDEERDRAFLSMLMNVIVAAGLIYGILVLQFRSFLHPLLIFTSIPIAFGGSVAALFLTGWAFSFTAFIGLLALTGIVVNNAIVLVDRINQLRRDGASLADALVEGATSRIQPILLTTVTTISGLLPLTLSGSSMWAPLGWVVIGGLLSSTIVTLLLVPTSYFLMERRGENQRAGGNETDTEDARGPRWRQLPRLARIGLPLLAITAGTLATASEGPTPTDELPRLGFDEVLSLLEERSPELAIARTEVDAAAAKVSLAGSTRWPILQMSADWEVTDDPFQTFGVALSRGENPLLSPPPDHVDAVRAEVRGRWVLWDVGRGAQVDAAHVGLAASESGAEWVAASVRYQAAAAYFGLVASLGEVAVQEAALAQIDRELEDARARLEVGRTVEADVLGLEARRHAIDAERIAAEGDVNSAEAALGRLLGLAYRERFRPDESASIATPAVASLEDALAMVTSRADLEASARAANAAELAYRSQRGERWPKLVASGSYTSTTPEREWDSESRTYAAAVGFEWTAFRGGGIGAEIEAKAAEWNRRERMREQAEASVVQEVVEAWSGRETAQRRLDAARAGLAAAAEARRVVELRFHEGRETLARYLEAERAHTEAASLEARSRAGLSIAEARLAWAVGETPVARSR
ncbi:MAG: efflux RND transporter permease subunit [Candidatus Eisenbacteria bacterium]